jgi:hypothetical protein
MEIEKAMIDGERRAVKAGERATEFGSDHARANQTPLNPHTLLSPTH